MQIIPNLRLLDLRIVRCEVSLKRAYRQKMRGVPDSVIVRDRCLQNFCKCQNGGNGVCWTSVNIKMGEMAFAGLLQTSKWEKWPLQERCKRHGNMVGICRNAASVTEIRLAFAGTLQRPRRYGWYLQECCKGRGDTVGLCRNAASAAEIRLAFAGTLQTPRETGHMIGYLLLEVSFAGAIKIKDENHII